MDFADKLRVERRKEPRLEISQEVTVTILDEPGARPFQATAVDISGTGMRILSPHPVKYQAAVQVQARDLLLLGEVIRVEACEQGILLALKLGHSLGSLDELHRLNLALRWEDGQRADTDTARVR